LLGSGVGVIGLLVGVVLQAVDRVGEIVAGRVEKVNGEEDERAAEPLTRIIHGGWIAGGMCGVSGDSI